MKKIAQVVILLILLFTAFFVYKLKDLGFDYDYEKYFPKDNEQMETYSKFKDKYGDDSDFVIIGIENSKGVFNRDFLTSIKSLGDSLFAHSLIVNVLSPVHNAFYLKEAGLNGVVKKDYIDLSTTGDLKIDSVKMLSNPFFRGSILPKSGNSVSIILQTEGNLSKERANSIISHIESCLANYSLEKTHVSGRIIAQTYYVQQMMSELLVFISTSVVLLIAFLFLSFRSIWGIVVPLFIVIISNVWTMAIMYFTGKSFDLLMMMLPTIIFVVGMSDLIHLLTKYLDGLRSGLEKNTALRIAFKEVRWATFLTSLTTAIGFFALLSSNIQPIREFGLYSGIGVFVAYFLAFTFLPAVLFLTKPPKKFREKRQGDFWNGILRKSFVIVLKRRKRILGLTLFLILFGIYSMNQLEVNNYLLEDLSDNDPVKKDVLFFEKHYSGIRPFELILKTNQENGLLDYQVAQEIDRLEKYLSKNYTEDGVGFLSSPITAIKEANWISHGNKDKYRSLPTKEFRYDNLIKKIDDFSKILDQADLQKLFELRSKTGRISGKINDIGGVAIKLENEKFNSFVKREIDEDLLQVELTGTALLIDDNNSRLALNLIKGLLVAFFIVALIIAVMFRSVKLALFSLVPNILPLLLVTSVMWLSGIDLKISTSLIFTLAFGIAVDDTLHLLAKYKLELKKGSSSIYALKRSYLSSGKAIIVTTLILIGGFLTLMFSTFASTFYMGLLISITLLIAVILDLLIMPLIIIYSGKK